MVEAGIRDLRNHLSRYLDRVREGEELVVTDRGTPIARADLAQGDRVGRITAAELGAFNRGLDDLYAQLDLMEIDDGLVRRAGWLAKEFGSRGYDAVHLATAERLDGADVVLATGDAALAEAAKRLGPGIGRTGSP